MPHRFVTSLAQCKPYNQAVAISAFLQQAVVYCSFYYFSKPLQFDENKKEIEGLRLRIKSLEEMDHNGSLAKMQKDVKELLQNLKGLVVLMIVIPF